MSSQSNGGVHRERGKGVLCEAGYCNARDTRAEADFLRGEHEVVVASHIGCNYNLPVEREREFTVSARTIYYMER